MMDDFIASLEGLDPQPTAEELADALWLAQWLSPRASTADEQDRRDDAPVPGGAPPGTVPVPEGPVVESSAEVGERGPLPAADVPVGLFVPARGRAPSGLTRSPAIPALSRTLPLARALRPLRRNALSRTEEQLDEEATADLVADTRIWVPVIRPAPERWLDLALVVDDSASMVIWQRMSTELRTLLERVGAFRDIRVWRFDTDADPLVLHAEGGARRSPEELIDPTLRRIVLVVSDCIGRAWGSGAAAGVLQRWGRAGPVAILQPLPQRLWTRCVAAFQPVSFSAAEPGLPNDRLTVRPRDGQGLGEVSDLGASGRGQGGLGVPIPVMEVEARWLAPWATMVSAGSTGFTGMALFSGRPTAKIEVPTTDAATLPAIELVMRFRATASPAAFRLAGYLAASPLRLPVMRLVQQAMLPQSRPAHLAEVFLGDLLRRGGPADRGADPEEVEYDFRPGVRDVLLGGLQRTEALRILRNVWELIKDRIGSPLDFPALLSALERGDEDVRLDRPFASVAAQVLRRLGGRYGEVADRLAMTGPGHVAASEMNTPPSGAVNTSAPPGHREAGRPRVWGDVPPRNPNFTGRHGLLRELRERPAGQATVLFPHTPHGLGGVGKTQVAVEYAHRSAADYDLVWWIPAEQITLARSSLAELGRRLGVSLSSDINRTVANVLDALTEGRPYDRWLLIYDNAGDPEELVPLIPSGPGHVLITSRDTRWEQHAGALGVSVFERAESIALLRRRLPRVSWAEADRLAGKLGDLPLAVEQAAAWLSQAELGAEDYVRLLERQLDRFGEDLPEDYPPALAATWGLAFERLQAEEPAAGQLLQLCAFFGPEPISIRLLTLGRHDDLPSPLRETINNEPLLERVLRCVGRYSLARVDHTHNTIQLHRLVQAVLRARLTPEERETARRLVHSMIAAANPDTAPGDETTWDRRAEIVPHIVPSGVIDGEGEDVRRVALDQVRYLYVLGDYEESRLLGERVLERWKGKYGPDDEQTLVLAGYLANTLRSLGDIAKAASLNADVFQRTRRRFGADHELTLIAANSVGADLRLRGDFARALALDRDTFPRARRIFGENDTRSLRSANNLGVSLRLMGDFQAALELDTQARERLERHLGPHHRDTILVAVQVARDLHGLGRYQDALWIYESSLAPLRQVLGEDHRFVLEASLSYSVTLRKTGVFHPARHVAEDTLRLYIRRFGDKHPDTLGARSNFADHLVSTGKPAAGKVMAEEALSGYQQVLGADHPFAYAGMAHLGMALRGLDDPVAAYDWDRQALAGMQRLLGADHYYVVCCAIGQANDLYLLEHYEAAHQLSAESLERSRRTRGREHPYTLASAHNHALILQKMGRAEEALALRREVLPLFQRVLGDAHPETSAAVEWRLIECALEPIPT
jgi:tetratricopeptide (TPR) repeat protein